MDTKKYISFSDIDTMRSRDDDAHRATSPYVRIVVDEAQWPLLLDAIRTKEFSLREELRRVDPDDATAVMSVKARIRALGRSRKLLISCVRERGWLQ
jgi:hypothetical protein